MTPISIFGLIALATLLPLTLWMVVRGERHLNRKGAWSMAATTSILALLALLRLIDPSPGIAEAQTLAHRVMFAGWLLVTGSLAFWLVRDGRRRRARG